MQIVTYILMFQFFPSYPLGWHDYSKMLNNRLQNLLVVPMGTQTYDKKDERARTHPQLAIGHSIFSTIA